MDDSRQPIIIGVGQQTWRERDPSRSPVDALQAVVTTALSDTGSAQVLNAVDAMVLVPFILDQVPELAAAMPTNAGAVLADRLGIQARQFTADVGGNLPQQLVNDFAGRLARNECDVALISGVELLSTFLGSIRRGEPFPDWSTGREDRAELVSHTPIMTADTENRHGLYEPIHAYPLFESALAHARGLDMAALRQELGDLVASMSLVSAANPHSWKATPLTAEEVLSTEGGNRIICHPYTKIMNSVIAVDQAACVVMTTVGKARELAIPEEQWIYLRGAADLHDSWFLSHRQQLHESTALRRAAAAALDQAQLTTDALEHFDLYSCFPAAVRVACDALDIREDDPRGVTVTGGMFLFGGPGNNYSLHAIASMTERLRASKEGCGLVTANGGYLTKQSVGVYAKTPGRGPWSPPDCATMQAEIDSRKGPELADEGSGAFVLEAHTVRYEADAPANAIAIGRLSDGRRCVAISDNAAVMEQLTGNDAVGVEGAVQHRDGINRFSL